MATIFEQLRNNELKSIGNKPEFWHEPLTIYLDLKFKEEWDEIKSQHFIINNEVKGYGKSVLLAGVGQMAYNARIMEAICRSGDIMWFPPLAPNNKSLSNDVISKFKIEIDDMIIPELNKAETAYERAKRLEKLEKARQMKKHRETCEKGRKNRKRN